MSKDFEVVGLRDLARLSVAMRAAGEQGKGLRRELASGINRETKTTRAEMRKAIIPGLPKSGGLAADVQSKTRFTTSTRPGASNLGVSIRVRSKRSIRRMNATGTFRHPVFGNRSVWVNQSAGVEAGFLDEPFEKARPALQRAIVASIARVRAQIYRSV